MVSRITPNAPEMAAEHEAVSALSAKDVAYTWEHRYRHALDNAKRCRRLARYIVTDERLSLGLEQLATDYETLATWLRRH